MTYPIIAPERQGSINGVDGRFTGATVGGSNYKPGTLTNQTWISETRLTSPDEKIRVEIRFDDSCRNGHNSFGVTCTTYRKNHRGAFVVDGGGAAHDLIAKAFPELAPLLKWHFMSADGPMHYVANTVYHAGDLDHWHKRKGEPYAFKTCVRFGDNPIKHRIGDRFAKFLKDCAPLHGQRPYDFEVLPYYHDDNGKPGKHQFAPKYTFGGFADKWHECPFDTEQEALDFLCALQTCNPVFVDIPTLFSDGKDRDLEAARSCAIWPEATDADLMQEPEALKAALIARLPALIEAFKADIAAIGFMWAPPAA